MIEQYDQYGNLIKDPNYMGNVTPRREPGRPVTPVYMPGQIAYDFEEEEEKEEPKQKKAPVAQ